MRHPGTVAGRAAAGFPRGIQGQVRGRDAAQWAGVGLFILGFIAVRGSLKSSSGKP